MSKKRNDFEKDLLNLSKKGMRKSIDAIKLALDDLQNPEKKYPIVHIAGTNGKGSTCSYLAQILAQNSYRVGLALSPHVETYRERIQFFSKKFPDENNLIPEEDLLDLHERLKNKNPNLWDLTYYEYFLLLGLQAFHEKKMDIVILETGLGGRFDATNACDSIVSGITNVGWDHMAILGDTLEKILLEKIQIVKPNSDFVFASKEKGLVEIAKNHCEKQHSYYHSVLNFQDRPEFLDIDANDVVFENLNMSLTLSKILNEKYDFKFDQKRKYKIKNPKARFEILKENPVVILDAAHNEPALQKLKKKVLKIYGSEYDLVFGCLAERDALELAKCILPEIGEKVWLKFSADGRESTHNTFERLKHSFGGQIHTFSDDFSHWLQLRSAKRPLLVCGSFYLCGQFRTFFLKG